jgi:hypothetical protein
MGANPSEVVEAWGVGAGTCHLAWAGTRKQQAVLDVGMNCVDVDVVECQAHALGAMTLLGRATCLPPRPRPHHRRRHHLSL